MLNFPDPISNLPQADIPLPGATAYLSQGPGHQVLFMEFAEDVDLPEHSHAAQWGIVDIMLKRDCNFIVDLACIAAIPISLKG